MLTPENTTWHETADVIVIGYGLAGAVSAITAYDREASVILLEKQSARSMYSCSAMSGGSVICPTSSSEAAQYMTALSGMYPEVSWTDSKPIETWARYAVQNKKWLEGIGANLKLSPRGAEHPQFPGAPSIRVYRVQGTGFRMMGLIYRAIGKRNISVHYEIAADRLFTNSAGEVIGVRAYAGQAPQEEINFRATKAVILCCGGFEFNEEMKLQYLRAYPVYFSGGIGNTGDGIKMAQEVGADLWHMTCVSARLVAKFPDFPFSMTIEFGNKVSEPKDRSGCIIVNKRGDRYTSENLRMHGAFYELTAFDSHALEYPKIPSYMIFDQRRMKCGPVVWRGSGPAGPVQIYHWSLDNFAELEKGWISSADSLKRLAAKIGIAASPLEKSVEGWNTYCRQGKDSEFDRKPEDLIPIDLPPFYAIKLYPGGPNTQGGPRRNGKAQVLNPFGSPIPGLYAAGECGSIYGMLYPTGGGNLAECIAFGRVAAENATNEIPRGG